MKLLNPGYENETVGGSLYYNSKSGTCYNGQTNATTSCNFTSSGIKNEETKNKIAEVTWNLGGWNSLYVSSDEAYTNERGTKVDSGRSTTWPGRIALPYPSDYGYATDFNKCMENLYNYDYESSTNSYGCKNNDWMYPIISSGWLLTPRYGYISNAGYVYPSGNVSSYSTYVDYGVAPVLYLSSEQVIEPGYGTSSNPYQLSGN